MGFSGGSHAGGREPRSKKSRNDVEMTRKRSSRDEKMSLVVIFSAVIPTPLSLGEIAGV